MVRNLLNDGPCRFVEINQLRSAGFVASMTVAVVVAFALEKISPGNAGERSGRPHHVMCRLYNCGAGVHNDLNMTNIRSGSKKNP